MRRALGALLLSSLLHGVPLLLAWALPSLRWPGPPLPIEIVLPHRSTARPGPTQPGLSRATPSPTAAPTAKRGPGPRLVRSPPPPSSLPPPQTADLRPFAPGDATIVVLLRTDRLRRSPHRAGIEALLEALPDYHTLLAGTGLTALADFDALLIATANPTDVTATFLAARHPDDARLRDALARRALPSWDPRTFRSLGPRLSVLARPELAAQLDAARSAPTDGGEDERRWLEDLRRFDRAADAASGPSLLVSVSDVGALAQLGDGLPTPASAALAATADASPSLRLRLAFGDDAEAVRFAAAWPAIVARFRSRALLLGLSSMLDGLVLTRDGATIDLSGRVAEGQARIALGWARALLPHPVSDAPAPGDGGAADPVDSGAR